MKLGRILLGVLLVAALGATAHAQTTPTVDGVKLNDRSASGRPCGASQACIWRNGLLLTWSKSDGTDFAAPTTVYRNTTSVASVTSGQVDAQSYTLPANSMLTDGQKIVFNARFQHAANTNSATYLFIVNGTAVLTQARTVSAEPETVEVRCVRQSSSVLFCSAEVINGTTVTGAGLGIAADFTTPIIIKTAVSGATANGDMTAFHMRGELWP